MGTSVKYNSPKLSQLSILALENMSLVKRGMKNKEGRKKYI